MYKYKLIDKNIKQRIIFAIILSCFFLAAHQSFAKTVTESFSVSPIISQVSLTPGETTQYNLQVINNADIPLGIHTAVSGYDETQLSGKPLFSQDPDSPMIQWTRIEPNDMIIDTHERATLHVTIQTPKTIRKGGYYAALFLTPFIAKPQDALGPIILSRVGALVIGNYGAIDFNNLEKKVQVTNFSLTPVWNNHPTTTATFMVKNAYFAYFTAKPFLTLTPLFGKALRYQLEEKHILPTKSKEWQTAIMIPSTWMVYRAQLATSVGQGHYIYSNTILIVIPYAQELFIASFFIFFMLVLIFLRKRLWRSLQILFRGR